MMDEGLVFAQPTDTVLEVRDTISNQQYRIEGDEPIKTRETDYDDFPGPVTDALVLDTDGFQFPVFYAATIRDEDGDMSDHLGIDGDTYSSESGTKFVELHTPVKTYLRIDGGFECRSTLDEVFFEFSDSTQIVLGARAWQCYPTETITVSDSPDDLREAISYFGNEILTTSPERSFPTLRGHPSRVRVGDSLDVPDSLSKPDAGITITAPPTKSALLSVAPLAYYLLAPVESGDEFRLETEHGFTYRPPQEQLSDSVQSVLRRCFFLDCLVRTEGLYPFDLQERRDFEAKSSVELDFAELYDQSLRERTETYFEVDSQVITELAPDWPVTAFVEPGQRATEGLPYLVYELADIRSESLPRYTGNEARKHALEAFTGESEKTRSTSLVFENKAKFVDVPHTDSQQTIWVGDGIPLNATKFLLEGYENNTGVPEKTSQSNENTENQSSGLEITVVCNDSTMAEEPADIEEAWDPRDDFPMELSTYLQVSTDQLRRMIESGTDYLHFVGHTTPDGLECVDGLLDVATVEESNVSTFFLNACQSYQQGKRLVERGSSGGIVTYSDISDRYALRIGNLIGRLLNHGFSIGACLNIIQETTSIGRQYTTVGTHAAKIIQSRGVTPYIRRISICDSGFTLEIVAYSTGLPKPLIGGVSSYTVTPADRYYLAPSTQSVTVDEDELREFLSLNETPVVYEGELQTKTEFFEAIED